MASPPPAPDSARSPVIGVTGAVAAGKSTVAGIFALKGCTVVDVDRLGHQALDTDEVRAAVVREFGAQVGGEDGALDRRRLAEVAFVDRLSMERLERLVHPVVERWIDREVAAARAQGTRAVVIDSALLFEGHLDERCDLTVFVEAAPATRSERAREMRGWSDDELNRREALQLPPDEKRTRATRVLENDGTLEGVRERVEDLLEEIAPLSSAPADSGPRGDDR